MSGAAVPPLSPPGGLHASLPVQSERLPFIDGLRGLAVLMVVAFHSWVRTIDRAIPLRMGRRELDLTWPLHYGYLGVHLFLLLSGFCLTYPLARRGAAALRVELAPFFRRRAWRILPPYYAALAAFVVLPVALHPKSPDAHVSLGNLLAHLLMVYNLFPQWAGTINGDFWSLALEWQLYLVFPLLLLGIRRWGPGPTLAGVLTLSLGYRTWVSLTKDLTQAHVASYYCSQLPGRVFEFALGMSAALLLAQRGTAWAGEKAGRFWAGFGLLATLGLVVTSRWSPYAPVTDVIWGGAFFCLLLVAAGRPRQARGRSRAPGSWRPLEGLGVFSYSVYLLHDRLIRTASALFGSRLGSPVRTLLFFELVMLPALFGLGWLFYRLVEARFIRMGKQRRPAHGVRGPVPSPPAGPLPDRALGNPAPDRELAPLG